MGILIHVMLDRGDVCFCVRLLSQRLKNPTEISMKRLIKVVKYLFITRDLELYFPTPKAHGQGASHIEVFTDSDWAGEQHHRKSPS